MANEERKRILAMLASGKITPDEAEDLLDAMAAPGTNASSENSAPGAAPAASAKTKAKAATMLCIKTSSGDGKNADINIPLALLRAGVKLKNFLPDTAREKVDQKLAQNGIDLDLNNPDNLEPLIEALCDARIDLSDANGDKKVQIYCE